MMFPEARMGRCKHIRRPCIVQLCRCTAVRIQKLHTRFHCHLLFSALKGKRSTGAAGHIQMLNRNFLMLAAHPRGRRGGERRAGARGLDSGDLERAVRYTVQIPAF